MLQCERKAPKVSQTYCFHCVAAILLPADDPGQSFCKSSDPLLVSRPLEARNIKGFDGISSCILLVHFLCSQKNCTYFERLRPLTPEHSVQTWSMKHHKKTGVMISKASPVSASWIQDSFFLLSEVQSSMSIQHAGEEYRLLQSIACILAPQLCSQQVILRISLTRSFWEVQ